MKRWLADFPTTQGGAVATIVLNVVCVLVLLGCVVFGREVQEGAIMALLGFVAALNGVEAGRFIGKRATYKGEGTGQ